MPLTPEEQEALAAIQAERDRIETLRREREREVRRNFFAESLPTTTTYATTVRMADWSVPVGMYGSIKREEDDAMEVMRSKQEKEREKQARLSEMMQTISYRLTSSYEYNPRDGFSNVNSLLRLHGSLSGIKRVVLNHSLPFYAELYLETKRTDVFKLSQKQIQAVESFIPASLERGECTAVARLADGSYLPAGSAIEVISIEWRDGYGGDSVLGTYPHESTATVESKSIGLMDCARHGDYYNCPSCRRSVTGSSLCGFSTKYTDRAGSHRAYSLCRECNYNLWRENGAFYDCNSCGAKCPEGDITEIATDAGEKFLCCACAVNYTFCVLCGMRKQRNRDCTHCRTTRLTANQVRTNFIPSRCKWVKEFALKRPDGTLYTHDSFISLSRSQGEVSNEGIDAIARLLHREGHYITFTSESRKEGEGGKVVDVTQDISYVHGKGLPAISKKIESFYYRHGMEKPDKETLQRIGQLASEHTPKEDATLYYALSREFDRSREFYCHHESCWWSQKPYAFCYIKAYGGMMLAGIDTDMGDRPFSLYSGSHCASRGAVLPLNQSGERLVVSNVWTHEREPHAYFLFNVYGVDGYLSMAKALSSIVGMEGVERVNIDPLNSDLWINGRISYQGELASSFGYLIYPKERELPESREVGSKYRTLSLRPDTRHFIERSCDCGRY